MSGANPWSNVCSQLANPVTEKAATARRNPRPLGVIRAGSATEAALKCLQAHPGQFMTYNQIKFVTRCTHAALSNSMIFLRNMGVIEVAPDARNERYQRYRYTGGPNVRIQVSQRVLPASWGNKSTDHDRPGMVAQLAAVLGGLDVQATTDSPMKGSPNV